MKNKIIGRRVFRQAISKSLWYSGAVLVMLWLVFQTVNLREVIIPAIRYLQEDISMVIFEMTNRMGMSDQLVNSCQVSLPGQKLELVPEKLLIRKINLSLPVVTVPLKDGTWEVLGLQAHYAQGTSLIKVGSGNVGLYGHDRPQAFAKIKQLEAGDEVLIVTGGYLVKYRVIHGQLIEPEEVDVFFPTDTPTLTLVTCDGALAQMRYYVRAEMASIEKLNCYASSENV